MRFAAGLAVTVVRPGEEDGHGDREAGTEHVLTGVGIQRRYSAEADSRGQRVTIGHTLLTGTGADVRATDQVRVDSGPFAGLYDVLGVPVPDISPLSGWRAGMTVELTRVEG